MKKITFSFFIALAFTSLTACNQIPVSRGQPFGIVTNSLPNPLSNSSTPLLEPAAPGAPAPLLDAQETDMLTMINQHRAEYGLRPLRVSRALVASSRWMSQDMAARNYFDHTDSLGRSCFRRMDDFNYQGLTSGENIACGNGGADSTYRQWLYSPGHNANMLGSQYNLIGIARAYSGHSSYGWYWTTDFGYSEN